MGLAGALSGCSGVFGDGSSGGGSRGRFEVPNETVTRRIGPSDGGPPRRVWVDRSVGEPSGLSTPTAVPVEVPNSSRDRRVGGIFARTTGPRVAVYDVAVRRTIPCRPTACTTVLRPRDRQFLTVSLAVDGWELGPSLPTDGEFAGTLEEGRFVAVVDGRTYRFDPEAPIASFAVPIAGASSGHFRWDPVDADPVRWYLDGRTLADLGAVPDLRVKSVTFPDRLQAGQELSRGVFEFDVVNAGGRDGEFLCEVAVSRDDSASEYLISGPAELGEVSTIIKELPLPTAEPGEIEVALDWTTGSLTQTISVE